MYVYLRQQWIDKRLAHRTPATLTLGGTDVERIWLPDTYITNANDYEVFTSNQLVLIDSEGKIFYFAYVRIAGACQMNLVKFPMDVQRCHLTLESCKYLLKNAPIYSLLIGIYWLMSAWSGKPCRGGSRILHE